MLEQAQQLLQRYFGYSFFLKGQANVIHSLLDGSDTLAIMPTGGGKSICYQIPSLMFEGITIVISPLIALMKDQVDGISAFGIPATFINSSLRRSEAVSYINQAGQGKYKLVYVAPERLELPEFLELARSLNISFVAVDEAHCISQWGHDFRPSYRKIANFIDNLQRRPVLGAFTATATGEIRKDIVKLLGFQDPRIFVSGFDRENLFFEVIRGGNKKEFVLDYIQSNRGKAGIIYAATRREVDSVFNLLRDKGYSCSRYHAGMGNRERENSQEAFIHDKVTIMVATNAFGMGIDKSNVRYVLHYNMPKNMEAYYQEAGRAGRDGDPGECIILFGAQDVLLQKYMIKETVYSPLRRKNEYHKLQTIIDYCHTTRCLRRFILEYFGEGDVSGQCNRCSNCSADIEMNDITIEAQKILSCVVRVRGRYGAGLVAEILKGSKNKKLMQLRFDKLSTYGLMPEHTLQGIKDLINLLAAEGYLAFTGGEFPILKLGRKAAAVLKGNEKVWQRRPQKREEQKDGILFEKMRSLRKEIAQSEGVPPYVVFPDSTLHELCRHLPRDRDSMLKIKGVGQIKMERFGEQFLQVINEQEQ